MTAEQGDRVGVPPQVHHRWCRRRSATGGVRNTVGTQLTTWRDDLFCNPGGARGGAHVAVGAVTRRAKPLLGVSNVLPDGCVGEGGGRAHRKSDERSNGVLVQVHAASFRPVRACVVPDRRKLPMTAGGCQ